MTDKSRKNLARLEKGLETKLNRFIDSTDSLVDDLLGVKPRRLEGMSKQERRRYLLKRHKIKSGFNTHLTVFASVQFFLFMIWLITTPLGFPWFFFPMLGWGIGLVGDFMGTRQKLKRLDIMEQTDSDYEEEDALDREAPSQTAREDDTLAGHVGEAHRLAQSLQKQAREAKNVSARFIKQLLAAVADYSEKIDFLAGRGRFIQRSLGRQFAASDPLALKEKIEAKLAKENLDAGTQKEYRTALRQISRQTESLGKLRQLYDTIEAKVHTAVINLKTLQIDLTRLEFASDDSAQSAIYSLHEKAEDIDEYMDILSTSLAGLDQDITGSDILETE